MQVGDLTLNQEIKNIGRVKNCGGWDLSQSMTSQSTKGPFRDAIALPYSWTPEEIPVDCVCGKSFMIQHALSCQKGVFPKLRHNHVQHLTASLLSEVCANYQLGFFRVDCYIDADDIRCTNK